ncbi:MAG: CDP-alcohol phosphatidyltransferase family protein [Pseudomonadota bacterium]|nr:CDP-alcohol phosphatidyltransferase family protein [Pseudomonadota bacterium]
MNIPNILTVLRILLVPAIVYLIVTGQVQLAFAVFVAAGVTDGLDGYLAKHFDWKTELGAYLDPLADKLLLVSIYLVLGLTGHIPVWLVIAVVSRDILIVGAVLLSWVLGREIHVQPLMISKVNTAGQIVLAALVLGDVGFELGLDTLTFVAVWITGGLTIISATAYLLSWVHDMAAYEPPPPRRRKRTRSSAGKKSSTVGTGRVERATGR